MVIRVKDHVHQFNTAADGAVIATAIRAAMSKENLVKLSFSGISDVPSSFINAAIVSLLDDFTEKQIKQKLKIEDVTAQIAEMIRRCLQNGINAKAA